MLNDIKASYIHCASLLGDYQKISVDDLANGYIMATEENKVTDRSAYLAALVLRFWFKIEKIYQSCHGISGYDREDCAALLAECIDIACQYRGWVDNPKLNAQQCINQVIGTRGAPAVIYEYNRSRQLANVNTTSLDEPASDSDGEISLLDTLEDDSCVLEKTEATSAATHLVQRYVNQNKIVEAIILDTIAFNDTIRYTTEKVALANSCGEVHKYKQSFTEFWPHKCVQVLSKLPANYDEYFNSRYSVKRELLDAALGSVRKANNQKLYKYLKSTLKDCRANLR